MSLFLVLSSNAMDIPVTHYTQQIDLSDFLDTDTIQIVKKKNNHCRSSELILNNGTLTGKRINLEAKKNESIFQGQIQNLKTFFPGLFVDHGIRFSSICSPVESPLGYTCTAIQILVNNKTIKQVVSCSEETGFLGWNIFVSDLKFTK